MPTRTLTAMLLAASLVPGARGQEDPGAALVRLANAFRKSQKLPPLPVNEKIARAARKHAENLARQDRYGDDGKNAHVLDGKGPVERARAEGYALPVTENAGGGGGPEDAGAAAARMMKGWERSPGHRANLLNKAAVATGAGLARGKSGRWYGCQLFGLDLALVNRYHFALDNRSGHDIMIRVKGSEATLVVPDGAVREATLSASTGAAPVLEVLPAKAPGKAALVRARDGGRYVITSDGRGGHKVEEAR